MKNFKFNDDEQLLNLIKNAEIEIDKFNKTIIEAQSKLDENMKYKSEFAMLCRELFFQTGKIGYYILANNVEKSLEEIDVLIDGKFELENKSYDAMYRGSTNQRIINVKDSLKKEKCVTIRKYKKKQPITINLF